MVAKRYDEELEVSFGGVDVTIAPLHGLKAIEKLDKAVASELRRFGEEMQGNPTGNVAPELREILAAGAPEITDEIFDNSTARERIGVCQDILKLNCLDNYLGVFDFLAGLPAAMREVTRTTMNSVMELLQSEAQSSTSASTPELVGETSTTN
jgi:hypothetical protein